MMETVRNFNLYVEYTCPVTGVRMTPQRVDLGQTRHEQVGVVDGQWVTHLESHCPECGQDHELTL